MTLDSKDLIHQLELHGITDADDSALTRAMYASDASLYRVVPRVVVRPRSGDDLEAILHICDTTATPITMRGAGTSIAGNAVGTGIVVDTVKHLNRIISIDPDAGTATVEPGVVQARLQAAAAPHGLRFGPDPSTHSRCTIGGMIGNNACGSRALGYGRTVDNVVDLEVLWGPGAGTRDVVERRLTEVADRHLAHVRTEFGRFKRQVSGYSLEHLLPEKGRNVDRFLVGSEGTLALVKQATVRLVPDAADPLLLMLGYPSMAEAADAVPALLAVAGASMVACEGLDQRIVTPVQARGTQVPEMPPGKGWLMVELIGEDAPSLVARIVAASGSLGHRLIQNPRESAALWRIREDGAGLAVHTLKSTAFPGWEDAAVPPERLGAWLRDFDELLADHGLEGVPYGHFGDGCVHVRIDFPFHPGRGESARVFRDFLTASAVKLRDHRGSLSGEHGDGRARSELLPLMYDPASIRLFEEVKAICDPHNLLNPGVVVKPAPLDDDLRPVRAREQTTPLIRLPHDVGQRRDRLGNAVHRCSGVGKCVAPSTTGVMCPSFLATRDEKDSTRGRSRVLQEAIDGSLVRGFADPAVRDALDLCLACKGCASDCPTGVDMATYKAEVLHQKHDVLGQRRPRSHLVLGGLPRWVALTAKVAPLANRLMKVRLVARVAKAIAGIDQRRSIPALAPQPLRRSATGGGLPDVWIWADTFSEHFFPGNAHAAIRYLSAAGLNARVIPEGACCGLTWITTGQLIQARAIMGRAVSVLKPYVESGIPVIGLEPSCLAALRSDGVELLGDHAEVTSRMLTLAELVEQRGLPLPDLSGVEIVAQPHCHHHAILGWEADQRVLERAGAAVTRVSGCCGLAGNFGMERGHYDVSVAIAETHLLPAVRANPQAVVLADGMSCRVQLDDLAGVPAMHLAELLSSRGLSEPSPTRT